LTAGIRWTSERREQTVDLELLDEEAYRDIAYAAIADVPGIIPAQALGIVFYQDLEETIAQDIYGTIQNAFPLDSFGQPLYPLISP